MLRKIDSQEDILSLIEIPFEEEKSDIGYKSSELLPIGQREFLVQENGEHETVYPLSLEEILKNSYLKEDEEIEEISLKFEEEIEISDERKSSKSKVNIFSTFWFLVRYITSSGIIFGVLLLSTNYQAYYSLAHSYFFKGQMIQRQQGLLNSVEAGNLQSENIDDLNSAKEEDHVIDDNIHSIHNLVSKAKNQDVNLDITITPYENRIIIPKIGKNIPLLEVQEEKVSGLGELNNIFMKELENGVVRYPGSGKPGKVGNAFIFGHSSNFPWIDGEYNDVFALLGNLEMGDEVIVYYDQQKYTYKIHEKTVISPDDVSVLKRKPDASEISLMTCWPIGTDLERLILIGELIESK